ncbi:MAG: fibronectin type III domain-containing protein [Actinomycetota bacterium]|nr:fibronectin type III domain-containing protein [Actinomycetota bacterium]
MAQGALGKRIAGLVVILVAACGLATPAHASWASSGAGPATAKADTLAPPTSLVATCAALTNVKLTWAASSTTNFTGLTIGYEVLIRTNSGTYGTPIAVSGLTYTTPSGLAVGTFFFTVRTTAGGWHSVNAPEVSKVIAVACVP